jgi:hypothetical protein
MDNLNLIDSTFRRICEIASMCGLVIKELPNGGVYFRIIKDDRSYWNLWKWENKNQFLLGDQYYLSLFKFIVNEYLPFYSPLSHKRYASFINLCKILKDCECIEEIVLKMDLMGI